jgi:hypothetical protein
MSKSASAGPSAAALAAFLDHLADTMNVTASCKAAGLSTGAYYRLKESNATFRKAVQKAMAEAHVRNEANLLAYANAPIANATCEKTIKQQAEKNKVRMFLMTIHKAAARGESKAAQAKPATQMPTAAEGKRTTKAMLDAMRAKAKAKGHDDDGTA